MMSKGNGGGSTGVKSGNSQHVNWTSRGKKAVSVVERGTNETRKSTKEGIKPASYPVASLTNRSERSSGTTGLRGAAESR